MKNAGTLPLVGAVRILALKHGVTATATLDRISCLQAAGALSAEQCEYLIGAYRHITQLLLRQQLRDAERGQQPSNHVHPKALSKREKTLLASSFRSIRRFRQGLRAELTGEIY